MASILEVLNQTGALPMEELKIRSVGSSEDVETRVEELAMQGMVAVAADPDLKVAESLSDERVVRLTSKGFRSAFRR